MTVSDDADAVFFRAVARDRHPTPACPASRTLRGCEKRYRQADVKGRHYDMRRRPSRPKGRHYDNGALAHWPVFVLRFTGFASRRLLWPACDRRCS